jgi:hypothetical protein
VEEFQPSLLNNLVMTQFSPGESEDARRKNGRPPQEQPPPTRSVFFEASSIRVFRGGEGTFILKLNHNWIIEKVDRGLGAVYNNVKRIDATESLKLW